MMENNAADYRRSLHKIPELDRDLPETRAFVESVLSRLSCEVFSPAEGAVCAFFDAGKSDAVAFRADMDALPVTEDTGLAYSSEHAGKMHACGHDGHMAMLLSLAEYIDENKDGLPHNVLLVFQPAEETTGGAKPICDSGVFKKYNVLRIFGFHIWPNLPEGKVFTRSGAMMARSSEISVRIKGRSVHISKYAEGADALFAGAEFLRRVYDMESSEIPEDEERLLRFGRMVSGTVRNALSDSTDLKGSMRAFSFETFHYMKRRCEEIAAEVSGETGCAFDVNLSEGYPPVINDKRLYIEVMTYLAALGAQTPAVLTAPVMAAEDFSWYQQSLPGLFFFIGAGSSGELHSPGFSFDDEILKNGVSFYEKLLYME
ncbi:MAG: amidohydrolase [Oscillospiraceae bacterium]|nr:amidohydrolase [Oscillospiraceae bacterium]